MTVAAQDQIHGMAGLEKVQDVGRMGQQHGESILRRSRNARHVSAVQGGIIQPDDSQLAGEVAVAVVRRDSHHSGLIHQKNQVVFFGVLTVSGQRHPTIVIVVPEGEIHRGALPQAAEKAEQMRDAFRNGEEIAGDKDPIGGQVGDHLQDPVMPREIAIEMQVGNVDRSSPGQQRMLALERGYFQAGKSDRASDQPVEQPVHGHANPVS
jgi:hypothetical protein